MQRTHVELIDRAEREIDLAAYVLTDWPIMQGLTREPHHCEVLRARSSIIV